MTNFSGMMAYAPQFKIYGFANGEWEFLFTWCRAAESGIARAKAEAPMFGKRYSNYKAEAI